MKARAIVLALALCALAPAPTSSAPSHSASPASSHGRAGRAGVQIIDNSQFIDINQIKMYVTNTGSIAWDKSGGGAGLEFPKGSTNTAVFAAGPWLGALVNGQTRLALSEYSDEYVPGSMIGGVADYPYQSLYKVYKLYRSYASTLVRDSVLADYNAGAVPHGAPPVAVLGDGTLGIKGDEMLWCVFNDADPTAHNDIAGSTLPLGVEVQLTVFAFNAPGPAGSSLFIDYKIFNKGSELLQNFYTGMWADPDLGGPTDDLAGCDPARSMGYAYNSTNFDTMYGSTPPAVGFDLLRGPIGPGGSPLPMTSFESYINGTDPTSSTVAYNALQGLDPSGLPVTNPSTGLPSPFWLSGDPVLGTGWLDTNPSDKRILLSSGPITLAPGQSTEATYALVIGQGPNRLASLQLLRCDDDAIQAFFDRSFALPLPVTGTCDQTSVINCPRTADQWYQELTQPGADYSPAQLANIAGRVDARSLSFDWSADPLGNLRNALNPAAAGTHEGRANREYAAFECNIVVSDPTIPTMSGQPIMLDPGTPSPCSISTAATLHDLAATAVRDLADARYLNTNATNPTPLVGVNLGGQAFSGGAATGNRFPLIGTLSPTSQPDSFPNVEIQFSHTTTQLAYRYLRLETNLGNPPMAYYTTPYLYGGFRTVPFTCWDLDHNVQLEVAFVERTLAADDGTIYPSAYQPATFDSTWAPDSSRFGGREYLIVFRRPYSGTELPQLEYSGPESFSGLPILYGLASHLNSLSAVIDDGDAFRFEFGALPGPSVDAMLIQIGLSPPAELTQFQRYDDISACLSGINAGMNIGPTCDAVTPTLISFVNAALEPGRASITWSSAGTPAAQVHVQRKEGAATWQDLGAVQFDGTGMLVFTDTHVLAGHEYLYRLQLTEASGIEYVGEVTVSVPLHAVLSLRGFTPNPAGARLQVAFSLANMEPAVLTIYDIAGRRRYVGNVGGMGPGTHLLPLPTELPSGLYMLRLEQGAQSVKQKAIVVR